MDIEGERSPCCVAVGSAKGNHGSGRWRGATAFSWPLGLGSGAAVVKEVEA